jgi:hypothetical protein
MPQEILPPEPTPESEPDLESDYLAIDPDDLPPPLAFTPVPRKTKPNAGINALRQRQFIAYLTGNGSVAMSASAVGVSASAFYQLKKAEGAESFSAAWDIAIDMGSRRVLDTLMDHAIHGVPEKLIKDGKVILERRRFNTRAMMWIVQQRFPEQYGGSLNITARPGSSMPHGLQKLKAQWEEEWQAKHLKAASEDDAAAAVLKKLKVLNKRIWHQQFVPWMDDAEKRAAADLLFGVQDWDEIRRRARRDEPDGALEPACPPEQGEDWKEEARIRGSEWAERQFPAPDS